MTTPTHFDGTNLDSDALRRQRTRFDDNGQTGYIGQLRDDAWRSVEIQRVRHQVPTH